MPAYKFMLGASGVGFLIVGDRWIRDPGPPALGWAGTIHPLPIVPFSIDPAPTAAAFRLGIPNYLGIAATAVAVALLVEQGAGRIGERIRELSELVSAGSRGSDSTSRRRAHGTGEPVCSR